MDRFCIALFKIPLLYGVYGDQIHMSVHGFQQLCQPSGMGFRIIHALDQAVLVGHPAMSSVKIVTTGVQCLLQRIAVGHRHQRLSLLVRGSVQGKGKGDWQSFLRQRPDLRHQSAAGDRNAPEAESVPLRIGHQVQEPDQIVIVIQRFSRSHDHDAVHPPAGQIYHLIDLSEHFRRSQVAYQSADGGCTESASHPAACLGRYAKRIPVMIRHEYGFDDLAVIQPEQELLRSVLFGP